MEVTQPSLGFARPRKAGAIFLLGIAILWLCSSGLASGSDLTVITSFGYQPEGEYPEGRLVQGLDGTLYGTTNGGGVYGYGMAFSVTSDGTLATLHSFAGTDGQQLTVGLTLGDGGTLFGTTPQGSYCIKSSCTGFGGSVFRLSSAGTLATLHYFAGNGSVNGSTPGELTNGGDGYFYGTTSMGGAAGINGLGTVFKVAPTGKLVTLHSFTAKEPYYPESGLTKGADGDFYGATGYGPANKYGTIFKVTPTGALSTVHSFSGPDGSQPNGRLLLSSDGNFYGTTDGGGAYGAGTLFRLSATGELTTLYSFSGSSPASGLAQGADGTLYGVTGGGGDANGGTLFGYTLAGTFTTLHVFEFAEGLNPSAGPILGQDGLLYGTTVQGGSGGVDHFPTGTVYSFDPAALHPPVLSLTKECFNELGTCLPPYDSFPGGYVGLSWFSANVSNCVASGAWKGAKPTDGNIKFQTFVPGQHTYVLNCASAAGPVSATATIVVGP
jgi:uncharacterized repeat protein (TIGR03803 family)